MKKALFKRVVHRKGDTYKDLKGNKESFRSRLKRTLNDFNE